MLVSVSVVSLPTNVSVDVGRVRVPVFEIVDITGEVNVLLVSVSVVSLATNVRVPVGKVIVPELEIEDITGSVSVLLVNVCVPVVVTTSEPNAAPVAAPAARLDVPISADVTTPPLFCRTCPLVPAAKFARGMPVGKSPAKTLCMKFLLRIVRLAIMVLPPSPLE